MFSLDKKIILLASVVFPEIPWQPSSGILIDEIPLREEDLPLLESIYKQRFTNRALKDLLVSRLKKAPCEVRQSAMEKFLKKADAARLG